MFLPLHWVCSQTLVRFSLQWTHIFIVSIHVSLNYVSARLMCFFSQSYDGVGKTENQETHPHFCFFTVVLKTVKCRQGAHTQRILSCSVLRRSQSRDASTPWEWRRTPLQGFVPRPFCLLPTNQEWFIFSFVEPQLNLLCFLIILWLLHSTCCFWCALALRGRDYIVLIWVQKSDLSLGWAHGWYHHLIKCS